ncbi:MAG TPA: MBL fold metallo-hydrolase [Blastocatellia bacterium]|nr:MBL fold metallo-hydrolase [Blastocatellia bacterium]
MRIQLEKGFSNVRAGLLAVSVVVLGLAPRAALPPEGRTTQSLASQATKLVLLGTGTPNADPDRSGPALAIVVNNTPYILDCGPGVVRRAAGAVRNGVMGLEPVNLKTVFITHLHSDHTTGLADLILTPWTLERKQPLEVYGPRGIKAMTRHLLAAYREDIQMRLNGGEPSNRTGYTVSAHEIQPGVVFKDTNITVKAFAVSHGSWKQAFGYRFETADRTIVVSGDCKPSASVAENCNGCDVLIHEVYSTAGLAKRPLEWQRYHSRYHTSSKELAQIATNAKPGLLVLYHQLFWGTSEEDLLSEVQQAYKGKVVSGRDLDVY